MLYQIGDVVYAYVPFEDGRGVKPRPVIILKLVPENSRYVIAECYSDKDHYDRSKGILVKEGTELFAEMGFKCDTFITMNIKAIYEKNIISKWGVYPHINEFLESVRRFQRG